MEQEWMGSRNDCNPLIIQYYAGSYAYGLLKIQLRLKSPSNALLLQKS